MRSLRISSPFVSSAQLQGGAGLDISQELWTRIRVGRERPDEQWNVAGTFLSEGVKAHEIWLGMPWETLGVSVHYAPLATQRVTETQRSPIRM